MNFSNISFKECNNSEDDFNLLKEIHQICMEENVRLAIGNWDINFQHERLKFHFIENGNTLKFIEYDNEVIGTINFHLKDFEKNQKIVKIHHIQQLYIKPNYQGKGLGKFLLNLFTINKEVRLSVLKNDKKAIKFYEKNGFKKYHADQYQLYLEKK